ncbi:MAG: cysteine hydrolase [Herminiimonas sp.]|nr:cysteine hydrolase [Herminiimonas sp.]
MKSNLHLLLIDPQNDFCDLPADYLPACQHAFQPVDPPDTDTYLPALPVPGAHADMLRVADLIGRGMEGLSNISLTLDSHHRLDIAHPTFWKDARGNPVLPFTVVSVDDVRNGRYLPRNPMSLPRTLAYLDALETAGRYQLMVWPIHCQIGSWGHNIHADVLSATNRWEDSQLRIADKISKGTNPWTEHYSAVLAEVPDADDPATQLNRHFLDNLAQADRVFIVGEAGSHCVKATTEHIVDNADPATLSKFVLLTDCMSPVTGFDAQYDGFVHDMKARGVQLATAADVLPDLIANARR